MTLKLIHPAPSFTLLLPESIKSDDDPRVMSYWVDGDPLLLQLSAYLRSQGEQVSAAERLAESIREYANDCLSIQNINPDEKIDQATIERVDKEGDKWIQTYLVWPHLAIYATVIGPAQLDWNADSWAIAAIRTISPMLQ